MNERINARTWPFSRTKKRQLRQLSSQRSPTETVPEPFPSSLHLCNYLLMLTPFQPVSHAGRCFLRCRCDGTDVDHAVPLRRRVTPAFGVRLQMSWASTNELDQVSKGIAVQQRGISEKRTVVLIDLRK